jgi:protease IV
MNEPRRRSIGFWLLIGGGLFVSFVLVVCLIVWATVQSISGESSGLGSLGRGSIGVVDVEGVILSADTLVDQIRKFDQDDSIKAIILHINSPGGGAAASQEIYHEVQHVREGHRKPIIASVESEGASGAYYIASATNKIYANEASVVGSIGVIAEWVNYGELLKWAKLKNEILKAGILKDAGSPTRDLTPEERAYMQGLIDDMHTQFIRDVAAGRKLPVDQIRSVASGRVWTGEQALPLHLIDKIGTFRDALLETARQVGLSGEPIVVKPKVAHKGLLDLLTGDPSDLFPGPGKLLERNANFYYLWK